MLLTCGLTKATFSVFTELWDMRNKCVYISLNGIQHMHHIRQVPQGYWTVSPRAASNSRLPGARTSFQQGKSGWLHLVPTHINNLKQCEKQFQDREKHVRTQMRGAEEKQ